MDTTENRDDAALPPRKLAAYERYEAAQEAVDRLSDDGFAVEHVSIVWSRLRRIEYVTGRRTVATAAAQGALSGLWFGALIGLAFAFWGENAEGVSDAALVVSWALQGAIAVALWMAVRHWMQRGRRDFSTQGKLDAESYEVWVHPAHIYTAAATLGISVLADEEAREVSDEPD